MDGFQVFILIVLGVFYAAYFAKMVLQRKNGIDTDQLGKGKKPKSALLIEVALKITTIAAVLAEVVSLLMNIHPADWSERQMTGAALTAIGTAIFIVAMATMKDSWRAGIPDGDTTGLVTSGVFSFSRNPAFVGFDLTYIGVLLAYPSWWHAAVCVCAVVLFHLQILREERYMADTFGEAYIIYKAKVRRYL